MLQHPRLCRLSLPSRMFLSISSSGHVILILVSNNPLKRKTISENGEHSPGADATDPGVVDGMKGEYETGRVICEVCRKGVSFRDEETGGFTLKHWDAHRLSWLAPLPPSPLFPSHSLSLFLQWIPGAVRS